MVSMIDKLFDLKKIYVNIHFRISRLEKVLIKDEQGKNIVYVCCAEIICDSAK